MKQKVLTFLVLVSCPLTSFAMVPLHSVVKQRPDGNHLWAVLVHGLDSSSHTWRSTMEHLDECNCLAVDQRGCGFSPLGDPEDFSLDVLVQDLHQAIQQYCGQHARLVLVGHSLGGRIVLAYAAQHASQVAAVIVEDMDISVRDAHAPGIIQLKPYEGVFDRQRPTQEAIMQALLDVGYPQSNIDQYLESGRISPHGQGWWSQVNPDFRKLCYPHILSTAHGRVDCQTIAQQSSDLPCHVLVAGEEGTVCSQDSVQEMKDILQDQLTIHHFPQADHSIHSTASQEFLSLVNKIIQEAKDSTQ